VSSAEEYGRTLTAAALRSASGLRSARRRWLERPDSKETASRRTGSASRALQSTDERRTKLPLPRPQRSSVRKACGVPKLDRALERGGLPLSRGRSLPALLGTRELHASVGFERLLAARTLAASAPDRIKAPHRGEPAGSRVKSAAPRRSSLRRSPRHRTNQHKWRARSAPRSHSSTRSPKPTPPPTLTALSR
jgi:hypothetical protein